MKKIIFIIPIFLALFVVIVSGVATQANLVLNITNSTNLVTFNETQINTSLSSFNLTFNTINTSQTFYISIPKTAVITTANMTFTGMKNQTEIFIPDYWTINTTTQTTTLNGLDFNDTYFFANSYAIQGGNSKLYIYNSSGIYNNVNYSTSVQGYSTDVETNNSYFWFIDDTGQWVWRMLLNGTVDNINFNFSIVGNVPRGLEYNNTYFWVSYQNGVINRYNSDGSRSQNVTDGGNWNFTYDTNDSFVGNGLDFNGTYFYIGDDINNSVIKEYAENGNNPIYTQRYFHSNSGSSSGVKYNNTYFWIVTNGFTISRFIETAYPYQPSLDTANSGGTREWNTPNAPLSTDSTTNVSSSSIQTFLSTCDAKSNGDCDVPFTFYVNSTNVSSIIQVSAINISYIIINISSLYTIPAINYSSSILTVDTAYNISAFIQNLSVASSQFDLSGWYLNNTASGLVTSCGINNNTASPLNSTNGTISGNQCNFNQRYLANSAFGNFSFWETLTPFIERTITSQECPDGYSVFSKYCYRTVTGAAQDDYYYIAYINATTNTSRGNNITYLIPTARLTNIYQRNGGGLTFSINGSSTDITTFEGDATNFNITIGNNHTTSSLPQGNWQLMLNYSRIIDRKS